VTVLLEHRSWIWPVMLFPHIERSHTVGVIGWRGRRPVVARDIRFSSAGRLVLSSDSLRGRSNLAGLWCSFEIARTAIESVRPSSQGGTLLEVRFRAAKKSRLLRYMTRGPLDGVVLLNLPGKVDRWAAALEVGRSG
jgi:hypothetical protein